MINQTFRFKSSGQYNFLSKLQYSSSFPCFLLQSVLSFSKMALEGTSSPSRARLEAFTSDESRWSCLVQFHVSYASLRPSMRRNKSRLLGPSCIIAHLCSRSKSPDILLQWLPSSLSPSSVTLSQL